MVGKGSGCWCGRAGVEAGELCKSGMRDRRGGRVRGKVCGEVRGNTSWLASWEGNLNNFPFFQSLVCL